MLVSLRAQEGGRDSVPCLFDEILGGTWDRVQGLELAASGRSQGEDLSPFRDDIVPRVPPSERAPAFRLTDSPVNRGIRLHAALAAASPVSYWRRKASAERTLHRWA
jgi:hypothetical protein